MPITDKQIENDHINTLTRMSPHQYLAMAREILASQIRLHAKSKGVFVTRKESLDAVFEAEAAAFSAGAEPKVDFFVPLTHEFPDAPGA